MKFKSIAILLLTITVPVMAESVSVSRDKKSDWASRVICLEAE